MMDRVVYVVQVPERRNISGRITSKFDLKPAEKYGRLIPLLGPTARPFSPEKIVDDLRHRLSQYDELDYILCIGNPILIGWATAIAADFNDGVVSMLQWSNGGYVAVTADLNGSDSQVY